MTAHIGVMGLLIEIRLHLDVGFTDLSSVVTERYVHDFIPKAIEVSERLRADGSGDRYVCGLLYTSIR